MDHRSPAEMTTLIAPESCSRASQYRRTATASNYGVTKAWRGMVKGRSTELTRPGCAATT